MEFGNSLNVLSGAGVGSTNIGQYNQPATTRLGIETAGAELYQAVEGVSKRISELESRLTTILQPAPPTGGNQQNNTPTVVRSGLLTAMLSTKEAVIMLGLRLDQLMGRIEL